MNPILEPVAQILKAARERKGLSQRSLATKAGVPQGHISKIENASVDLQTSSLIEIARALDLELLLIPRRLIPAVQALQRDNETPRSPSFEQVIQDNLTRILARIRKLEDQGIHAKALGSLATTLEDLRRLRFGALGAVQIQALLDKITTALKRATGRKGGDEPGLVSKEYLQQLDTLARELRSVRNALAHGIIDRPMVPVPAYQLDTEDGNG